MKHYKQPNLRVVSYDELDILTLSDGSDNLGGVHSDWEGM
jgi:hypothetical protein